MIVAAIFQIVTMCCVGGAVYVDFSVVVADRCTH